MWQVLQTLTTFSSLAEGGALDDWQWVEPYFVDDDWQGDVEDEWLQVEC